MSLIDFDQKPDSIWKMVLHQYNQTDIDITKEFWYTDMYTLLKGSWLIWLKTTMEIIEV